MKKVFKFALVALAAAAMMASCDKKDDPKDPNNNGNENNPKDEVNIKVDGNFDDWATVAGVDGQDAIIKFKGFGDDKNLYLYMELDNTALDYTTGYAFSNYMSLYFSDGTGESTATLWDAPYNQLLQIWMLTENSFSMTQWSIDLNFKTKVDGNKRMLEMAIPRSFGGEEGVLSGKSVLVGVSFDDTFCAIVDGKEDWNWGSETVGCAPEEGGDLLEVKFK